MKFIKNELTKLEEVVFNESGINFRCVQKKSKKLGMVVYFKNGKTAESYFDKDGNFKENSYGMAHFLEHLLFSSASLKIDWLKKLSTESVEFNGATGDNVVFYHVNGLVENILNEQIANLVKIAFTLDIDNAIFEKEKGIVSTEASLSQDSVNTKVANVLAKYYPNTHLSHLVPGTPQSVMGITQEEVINYYKEIYTLDNSEICLFGDFKNNPSLLQKAKDIVISEINNVRENFKIHVQDTGIKRKVAFPKNTVFDKKLHEIETPSIAKDEYRRYFVVKFPKAEYYDISSLNSFLTFINWMYNPAVKTDYEKLKFSMDTKFSSSQEYASYDEIVFCITTTDTQRIDEITKFLQEVVENYEKYDLDKLRNIIKNQEIITEYRSLDSSLASQLLTYPYRFLNSERERFNLPLDKQLDNDYIISPEQFKKVSKFIDFENYVDILIKPQQKK